MIPSRGEADGRGGARARRAVDRPPPSSSGSPPSCANSGRDDDAEIVETGALMAADPMLESAVCDGVTERGLRAAAALLDASEEHAAAIASLPDACLAARADDVRSLGRRAARIAAGSGCGTRCRANGSTFILVAEDLGPADVAEHGARLPG